MSNREPVHSGAAGPSREAGRADQSGPVCNFRWPGGEGTRQVNLGLQGGGAHGAYTWGVLDAVLADERIEIDGVSGTSAGAMNAVVMAAGLTAGGREGARAALENFWRSVRSFPI